MTTVSKLSSSLYDDEEKSVRALLEALDWPEERARAVRQRAATFIDAIRSAKRRAGDLESFLQQYAITSAEGVALMCLAEALLRIPDKDTAQALIKDKVAAADWLKSSGGSKDWLVKAAGAGLLVSKLTLESLLGRLGEPVIRDAMVRAMGHMGTQFVRGPTIEEAMKNARAQEKKGYRMSYDMLGEGARTAATTEAFFQSYQHAIVQTGTRAGENLIDNPGISVKLSALHPRYETAQHERCVPLMREKLLILCTAAASHNIALTVDAEESERLELSLEVMQSVWEDKSLRHWEGFGLAVQAYQTRCSALIDHLGDLAQTYGRRLQIRLVKGAYWDSEIKRAQLLGLSGYPVFTRKSSTDLSYLVCAQKLLSQSGRSGRFYPMFATHNAQSVASVLEMARAVKLTDADFEMQRLHGMGAALYDEILQKQLARVSVYAPVGPHGDLLPYLVRRLLENGANSSFVNRVMDPDASIDDLVGDPVEKTRKLLNFSHPKIPQPADIYAPGRRNSSGLDLDDASCAASLVQNMKNYPWPLRAPQEARIKDIDPAFRRALKAFPQWNRRPAEKRAAALERFADLLEDHREELMALCVREAGKTVRDAHGEIREAVDFCRYYAMRGRMDFAASGCALPGPTGEENILSLEGRGVFVCISPWNFPLAIFTGQVAAALMAGNSVIAKPAEQTPRMAVKAVELMHKAGVPQEVLQILVGGGKIGAKIVAHKEVSGVAFTGSTDTAQAINRALAGKDGPLAALIAETGGQNAMIVDSSALLEQVCDDVIDSAFSSAGQRCSALRVLYVQEEIAEELMALIKGAMAELRLGDPMSMASDIGPVIDAQSLKMLEAHKRKMEKSGRKIAEAPLEKTLQGKGSFFAPCAFEIPGLRLLKGEIFGPILHVIRYHSRDIDRVIAEINATGYGLTLGVHSRIDAFADKITREIRAGNAYVNRAMIGAVVGTQPFGGRGLSGTGPKAGGPYYLHRFATEKLVSTNITAKGGNASLVSLGE